PPVSSLVGMIDDPDAQDLAYNRPFDIRYAYEPIFLRPGSEKVNRNIVWMKTFTPVKTSRNIAAAGLAYGSGYRVWEPIMSNHGISRVQRGQSHASTGH